MKKLISHAGNLASVQQGTCLFVSSARGVPLCFLSKGRVSLSLAIMSAPPPKEKQKLSQKLSRWLKPSKRVADPSAASSHSTPVSSSPSHSLTHATGHTMDAGRIITPEALGKHIGLTTIKPLCP